LKDTPFHELPTLAKQRDFGVRVLYHTHNDEHYLRLEGIDEVMWYEITPYTTSLTKLPDTIHDALEEQYQW